MSSQVLSLNDEAGEKEGESGEVKMAQEIQNVRENGVLEEERKEEDEKEESEEEMDEGEEVLYESSSHDQLEDSSVSGSHDGTWEERYVHCEYPILLSNVPYTFNETLLYAIINRYVILREELEQVKAERDILKQKPQSNPLTQKV